MVCVARAAAFALLWMSGYALAAGDGAGQAHPDREVLPGRVFPIHYDLLVSPDAEALTFRGKVTITLEVRGTTPALVLNAVGLTFDRATLDGRGAASIAMDEKLGRATLEFGAPPPLGRHVLAIDYHGKIDRSTLGFFAMDYTSDAGPRRTLATNLEPAEARKLLPCWDEPARKATFTVSLDAPKDRMAISNMPIARIEPLSETLQRVRFAQTPKMSTYLLFLGVGDFERIARTVDGVDVGVVVKRGDTAKARYALDQASALLHYYNDYFGVAFPLPKLDLIAAPGQISGGSMENWGAIFYSQNHVLFDPAASTEADRQEVFLVISHEMAHQWFGDLVTMSWWDDLWLNEGFARWMQTFAADDLHPEWQTGLRAASILEAGKQADSVPSTHPVVQRVYTAEQAAASFDQITYAKGAAIVTMINAYVGRNQFRDGVRRYMRAHAYGNTADRDLWTIMQRAVGKPILAIERDFTRQEGLPLVRVVPAAGGVHLSQSRFAADPSTIAALPPQQWRLPLAVRPIGGATFAVLLQGESSLSQGPPLLVNAGQLGYVRVLYEEDAFSPLSRELGALEPVDQLGLFNDEFAFGIAGYSPPGNVLGLAAALPDGANPIVWQRVIRLLDWLDSRYADSPERLAFRRFALGVLAPLARRLQPAAPPGESANLAILRSALMEAQGKFGDEAVIALARRNLESGAGTPAEQRTALSIAAAAADAGTFDALLARAQNTADPLEKQHILQALCGVADPSLARRMLDVALGGQVPAGTAPGLIVILARRHPDMVWSVIAPRLDDPALPFDKATRWSLAREIAALCADPQRIGDLEAYEEHSVPVEVRKPFLEAVASIRQNQRLRARVLPEIDLWIKGRQAPQAASQPRCRASRRCV